MSQRNSTLTQDRVKDLLEYDPETGILIWRETATHNRRSRGQAADNRSMGYVRVGIDGAHYQAHRVIWLYMTGDWPFGSIDHINGVKTDNRWCNLRDISQKLNMQNRRTPVANSHSGVLGVRWSDSAQKWEARITVDGERIYLGRSADREIAGAMYIAAKRAVHRACTLDAVDL